MSGFTDRQNGRDCLCRRSMCHCRHVILLAVCWIVVGAAHGDLAVVRNEDICGAHNGRRLYLELGERGVLRAENVTLVKNLPRQESLPSRAYPTNSSHDQCSLELVTCPSCVIALTFRSINLQHHCGDGGMTIDSPCRCDYVWVSEPPFEDVSGMPFCGHYAPIAYRSSTRTLSIALLYSQSHKHAFTIEYTAERNRLILKGSNMGNEIAKSMNNTSGGILTSPFFPARYPRDLGMEYIITCPTEVPSCRVRVLFSDFQLATVSIMEFYDWNGQRLDVSSGARFRPPIIVSSGPSLLIRFYANGGTGLGYKAFYSFVLLSLYDKHAHPITDCGGYVENLGGAITMMDMVGEGVKTYDCVWLIRPPSNFLHMKTHVYLKVVSFAEMAGNTELIIKQGPTSALMPLEVLRHPVRQLQPPRLREHVAPVTSGFHVSLRGSFGPSTRLAIAYAAFSYMDCFSGSDFLCQNHRCISSQLNCDGFDHCGDNSDEPSTCLHDWDVGLRDRKWQLNKANYYFPKIDRYPDLKTATLVFIASSLGLIILIAALIILLYRIGARARQQRELQSRLHTISELLVNNLADGGRIDEISVSDDPPVYEAPPNYDEVIKIGMEDENGNGARRTKQRTPREARRSRSTPSSQCSCDYSEPQFTLNICEDGSSANRSSQATAISSPVGLSVPESPPPPYITPPGTVPRNFRYSLDANLPGPSGTSRNSKIINCNHSTESSNASTGPDSLPVFRSENHDLQTRRSWLRNSGSFSRSLPISRTTSTSPRRDRDIASSTSVDADSALGAYLIYRSHVPNTDCPFMIDSSLVSTSYNSRTPQLTRSTDASTSTKIECAVSCVNVVAPIEDEEPRQQDQKDQQVEGGTALQRAGELAEGSNDEEQEEEENDPALEECRPIVVCSCEGACGCASSSSGFVRSTDDDSNSASVETSTSKTLLIRRNSTDYSPSTKSRIIRLLAGARSTNRNSGIKSIHLEPNSSALSTNCSTPCTHHKPYHQKGISRKFSICSRDSCITKISTVSAYSSYEKLHDEFDIVSETASILDPSTSANTPKTTPNKFINMPLSTRHYSTGDLHSLYEGVKVLDSYLARKCNENMNEGNRKIAGRRNRPMTVMLFETPKHKHCNKSNYGSSLTSLGHEEPTDTETRIRIWQSADDSLMK